MSARTAQSSTVTIYAQHGPMIAEIADEIRARGASTHTVSIETGWVTSVSRALMVLDSPAGMSALRSLCDADPYGTRVVALMTSRSHVDAQDLCDRCIERHDLVIMRDTDENVVERIVNELIEPQLV